jgi:putative ABC transport system permease protein
VSNLRLDLRYGIRALLRSPGFTIAAGLTLALGIGATTTIFTVVNGVLLRPLPYEAPERLVNVWNDLGQGAQSLPAVSPLDFRDYQQRSRTFQDFAAASGPGTANLRGNLTGEGEPELVDLSTATANFFPVLGVRPELGRNFLPEEDLPNGPHVVLLTHDLWQRRYAGDPALLGKSIQIDGVGHTVVGILPAGFHLLLPAEAFLVNDAQIWAPMQYDYSQAPPRNFTFFTVFGRMKRGVTLAQAQGDMNRIAGEFRREFPEHTASNVRIRLVPLQQDIVKHARPALLILLGAVGLVLLIACANVAHLLLVRATVREREFALRAAVGASRWAMVRQLLTESLVLGVTGGLAGAGFSVVALSLLRILHPANLPRLDDVQMDGRVLAFTALTCCVTALVFGLVPAIHASRADPQASLQAGGRGGTTRGRHQARSLLIGIEVALSVVLLVGAGLLIRSFIALQQVRPGFDASDVLTFQLALPGARYPQPSDRRVFIDELERRLRVVPGVRNVGVISQLPLTGSGSLSPFAYDAATAENWESVTADGRAITPHYFQTMNARLLGGRDFTDHDVVNGPQVAIIDETLAKLAWPGQSAVGKRLQVNPTGSPNQYVEVVGVVEHMRSHDLTRAVRPQIFRPLGQQTPINLAFVLESSVEPASLVPLVRREVAAVDKDLPVHHQLPMTAYIDGAEAQARFSLFLMATLGGIALLLASVGIFGVISYSVTQRSREFGIRQALGEDPSHTRRTVVLRGMRVVLLSILIGLGASFGITRLLSDLLYQVSPGDPLTFAGISILLALVALLACYLPARRATRVSPSVALRNE